MERNRDIEMSENDYIKRRDDGYWICDTGVSLDSVVLRFLEGLSAESIQLDCFPVLTLEQVYGAIAYYLRHREEIDAYLRKADEEYELMGQRLRAEYSDAHRRLDVILQNAQAPQR
jgi:uncharacterized protein (DUF433 family)